MNNIVKTMFDEYPQTNDINQITNIIKQIMQEIVLSSLSRSNFFTYAAFNGGTALRIFHNLDRFSEDLDFSIIDDNDINLDEYCGFINDGFESLLFPAHYNTSEKDEMVKRGYIDGNLLDILNYFEIDDSLYKNIEKNAKLKIKLEVDTNRYTDAKYETLYLLKPYPSAIRIYDKGSLFAGKLDALLTRNWKNRVKGRDYYDYVFYISNKFPLNFEHLKSRLVKSKLIDNNVKLDEIKLKELLIKKFNSIDYESCKKDVIPFISSDNKIELWSKDFFISITNNYSFK